MDDTVEDSEQPTAAWSTPTAALGGLVLAGLVIAGGAVVTAEPASRLLLVVAAMLLLGTALVSWRQRPRLTLGDGKLIVGTFTGSQTYSRDDILRIRITRYRRLGRRTPVLEIDVHHRGSERLLIFGRWDLGTHPDTVFERVVTALQLPPTDD